METDALEFITNLIAIHQEIQLDEIAEELKNNPQERSIVKQYNFLDLISSCRTSTQRLLFSTGELKRTERTLSAVFSRKNRLQVKMSTLLYH